ncbi:MAG: hypothetical protein VB858_01535, partial [Planctomycetaceae bacterium]
MKISENCLRCVRPFLPGATALVLAALISPTVSQAAGDENSGEGLAGLLRAEVPLGLYEDDFLELGVSWESWSTGVAAEVAKLY